MQNGGSYLKEYQLTKYAIPYFNVRGLSYFRKENKGYFTMLPYSSYFIDYSIVNEMTMEILNYCDGINTINSIITEIVKKYGKEKER